MAAKPSIVFVCGACHVPEHYSPGLNLVKEAGYRVVISQNPSIGVPAVPDAFAKDVAQAQHNIVQEVVAGRDVVVVGHSYGGIVAGAALENMHKIEAEKDAKGSIMRFVSYAAFVLRIGESLEDSIGGSAEPLFTIKDGLLRFTEAEDVCYRSAPAEIIAKALPLLQPQAYETFTAKQSYEAWRDFPTTYIFPDEDWAMPPSEREVKPDGREPVVVRRLPCGHSPHVVMPEAFALLIREAAGEEVELKT